MPIDIETGKKKSECLVLLGETTDEVELIETQIRASTMDYVGENDGGG